MNSLPTDVLSNIFSFLQANEILSISAACQSFRSAAICPYASIKEKQLNEIIAIILVTRPPEDFLCDNIFSFLIDRDITVMFTNYYDENSTFTGIKEIFDLNLSSILDDQLEKVFTPNSPFVGYKERASQLFQKVIVEFSKPEILNWRPKALTHCLFTLSIQLNIAHFIRFNSAQDKKECIFRTVKMLLPKSGTMHIGLAATAISCLNIEDRKTLLKQLDSLYIETWPELAKLF